MSISKPSCTAVGIAAMIILSACGAAPAGRPSPIPTVTAGHTVSGLAPLGPSPSSPQLLPPLDLDPLLTFGAAGVKEIKEQACDSAYPAEPDHIRIAASFGLYARLCIYLRHVDRDAPMRIKLRQLRAPRIEMSSTTLVFGHGNQQLYWEFQDAQHKVRIPAATARWAPDGSVKFTHLDLWWPVTLPPGDYALTWEQSGLRTVSEQLHASTLPDKSFVSTMDARSLELMMPSHGFSGHRPMPISANEPLKFAGVGFPLRAPVLVALYEESILGLKSPIVQRSYTSDGSGFISGEIPGPDKEGFYILYATTEAIEPLSIRDRLRSCLDLRRPTGSACDTFEMIPTSCPGAPIQRMAIGQRGVFCGKTDTLPLHVYAGESTKTLVQLPAETEFTVFAGPSCADASSWWQVRLDNGKVGWLSEASSETGRYLICPRP